MPRPALPCRKTILGRRGEWLASPGMAIGRLINQSTRRSLSPDAVVVIPGIMGSTLVQGDRVLWGLERLGWYARAWARRGTALDALALTSAEREGDYGRVRATGLLKAPAWAPFLRGIEAYTGLVKAIRRVVANPAAVLEFSYDWRLPAAHNAIALEEAARDHLSRWRSSDAYIAYCRALPDSRPAQLVLVAHSMGGLLARSLPHDVDVRATVTLGTPFDGAATAAVILNTGQRQPIPLPRSKLREMVKTLPGVHDLLPTYRCLDDRDNDTDPRRLTHVDVEAIGGDPDLAQAAFAFHQSTADRTLSGHHALIGTNQPTPSTLTFVNGVLDAHSYTFEPSDGRFQRDAQGVLVRSVRGGDGTVPYNSGLPQRIRPATLAQQHGALASSSEAINAVCEIICERDPHAERLGDGEIGIELPDIAEVGAAFAVVMTSGVDGPTDATVIVHYDDDPIAVDYPTICRADGRWQATVLPQRPGIYRVTVAGGGTTPVTQLALAYDPARRDS